MDARMQESLDAIFRPRSVAIVGASNNRQRWGYGTMQNMLDAGYRNALYPVNPNEVEVQGLVSASPFVLQLLHTYQNKGDRRTTLILQKNEISCYHFH